MRLTKQLTLLLALAIGLAGTMHWLGSVASEEFLAFAKARVSQGDHTRLCTISVEELPPEARATLELIKIHGPFPYARDGTTFHNRERRLPGRPPGYFREYTVTTPGIKGRGPRRIVAGSSGELYYTEDHYRTFKRIEE